MRSRDFLKDLITCDVMSHVDMMEEFKKYKGGDKKAREQLIKSNVRLVVSIAKNYSSEKSMIPLEDLVQEGCFGLMTAVERFDHTRGYKFSTYASWWIKQSIGQFLLKKRKTIRLPAHAVTVQRYILSATEAYKKQFEREPTEEELIDMISLEKNIKVSKTVMNASRRASCGIISLQDPCKESGANTGTGPKLYENVIPDSSPSADPFDNVSSHELLQVTKYVLDTLTAKEAAIIRLRFGLCEDQTDSEQFPITEEELEELMHGKGMK